MADALSQRRHISAMTTVNFKLRDQILRHLEHDEFYTKINLALIRNPQDSKYSEFSLEEDGLLRYCHKIYVPNNPELRRLILGEYHLAPYSGHPGVMKMLSDIKPLYFWKGMKREIIKFVASCLECQRVKEEYRYPTGLLHPNEVPE